MEINTHRLDFEIYIDSIKVIEAVYNKPIRIRPSNRTVIEMPMEILAESLTSVLKYFEENEIDSTSYSMESAFQVDVPIAGKKNFTIDVSKRLPALRLLKMQIEKADFNVFKPKKEGIDMIVRVTNPNLFPVEMKEGTFLFVTEDDLEMEGMLERIVDIPAQGSEDISVHVAVKENNILKVGWDILADKKDTRFTFAFNSKVSSENKMLDYSNMTMNVHGTLDELKNALKGAGPGKQ